VYFGEMPFKTLKKINTPDVVMQVAARLEVQILVPVNT